MAYGGQSTYGLNPQQANARNRITQALMRIADPPPGGMLAPGTPPVSPQGNRRSRRKPPQPVRSRGWGCRNSRRRSAPRAAPVGAKWAPMRRAARSRA